MRSVIVFAVLALAASVVVPQYAARLRTTPAPVALAARPDSAAPSGNSRSMVVPRDARGHFVVDGHIDGRQLSFMVDTGASVIALTASDAARLGIHPAQGEFVTAVRTANGTVRAAPTQLDMVEIGDLVVRDVAALVLPDEALSDNLLGLSFLSRLRRFEYNDGKLVLEQ
jgi:aspartyl protease family protein